MRKIALILIILFQSWAASAGGDTGTTLVDESYFSRIPKDLRAKFLLGLDIDSLKNYRDFSPALREAIQDNLLLSKLLQVQTELERLIAQANREIEAHPEKSYSIYYDLHTRLLNTWVHLRNNLKKNAQLFSKKSALSSNENIPNKEEHVSKKVLIQLSVQFLSPTYHKAFQKLIQNYRVWSKPPIRYHFHWIHPALDLLLQTPLLTQEDFYEAWGLCLEIAETINVPIGTKLSNSQDNSQSDDSDSDSTNSESESSSTSNKQEGTFHLANINNYENQFLNLTENILENLTVKSELKYRMLMFALDQFEQNTLAKNWAGHFLLDFAAGRWIGTEAPDAYTHILSRIEKIPDLRTAFLHKLALNPTVPETVLLQAFSYLKDIYKTWGKSERDLNSVRYASALQRTVKQPDEFMAILKNVKFPTSQLPALRKIFRKTELKSNHKEEITNLLMTKFLNGKYRINSPLYASVLEDLVKQEVFSVEDCKRIIRIFSNDSDRDAQIGAFLAASQNPKLALFFQKEFKSLLSSDISTRKIQIKKATQSPNLTEEIAEELVSNLLEDLVGIQKDEKIIYFSLDPFINLVENPVLSEKFILDKVLIPFINYKTCLEKLVYHYNWQTEVLAGTRTFQTVQAISDRWQQQLRIKVQNYLPQPKSMSKRPVEPNSAQTSFKKQHGHKSKRVGKPPGE